jgi:Ca-activated chloride channel family protein
MAAQPENLQGIGKDDFIDDGAEPVEVRRLSRARRRVFSESRRGGENPGRSASSTRHLEAEPVCDESGRLGWRVRVPGERPLATPAVADGRVHVGGGFGSHEFYAFGASDGRLLWQLKTKDDGPTAATVTGEHVAFNTESCTVLVADGRTGRVVWESWLGDPLLAQTAIAGDVLFAVYPDRQRRHWLAAFELATGKPRWRTEVAADVISAPILADDSVYAATLDGTIYRVGREKGDVRWAKGHAATSAPWIHEGRIYMSVRGEEEANGERIATEGYLSAAINEGARRASKASSRRRAEYLRFRKKAHDMAFAAYDSSVGFHAPPASAKLSMAAGHLGVGHVASLWSFQGSRPEVFGDGIFTVLDDVVQRLELGTKKPLWRARMETEKEERAIRALSPPAVSPERLYLTSSLGDLLVLDRQTGAELWSLNVGAPILSQPALAEGKVFLGTMDGTLYAFETGETGGASWAMWGGGPGHNGPTG